MTSATRTLVPRLASLLGAGLIFTGAWASEALAQDIYELPAYTTYSDQVANQTPVASFAMPVSALRFEPLVDIQSRNLPEAQSDVTIRGGIFENTGFKLGAVSLFDPQTGHYLAEIPVAPEMLQSPVILTGAENAVDGFNAGVGTVDFGWRPIETRGEISAAAGDFATDRQSFYQGVVLPAKIAGQTLAADVELSRAESDGSVPYGDLNFKRAGARLQLQGAQSQTDLFVGTQSKFFGWPDLYTPFGVNETEDLHAQLYLLNHRSWSSPDDFWEWGASVRRNYDDYEYDRSVPGEFNPYQHTTYVRSLSLDGRQDLGGLAVVFNAQLMKDSLESTALTFGRFNTRTYLKLGAVPEWSFDSGVGHVKIRAGGTYDETNRDGSAWSPVLSAETTTARGLHYRAEYSESTQVPTYTALNSNPTAGLFRGNPDLGREFSRNAELGLGGKIGGWTVDASLFSRRDDHLVDWTYVQGVDARTANAVNITTQGAEIVAKHKTKHYDLVLGYAVLDKDADYGTATVDASFYALNYAKQRLTAAVVWRAGGGFEVRVDNQYRMQAPNLLRVVGGNDAFLTNAGLYYLAPWRRGLEFSVLVDNLWNSAYQEVPAVPASRREYTAGVTCRW